MLDDSAGPATVRLGRYSPDRDADVSLRADPSNSPRSTTKPVYYQAATAASSRSHRGPPVVSTDAPVVLPWGQTRSAKLIDSDESTYEVVDLRQWKPDAELRAERHLRSGADAPPRESPGPSALHQIPDPTRDFAGRATRLKTTGGPL